jgi:hypothetical protein
MKTRNLFNKALPFLFVGLWLSLAGLVYGIAGYNADLKIAGFVGLLITFTAAVMLENINETEKEFK